MRRPSCSLLLALAVVQLSQCVTLEAQQVASFRPQQQLAAESPSSERQPAPEPYSFSYTADSIGGQSSHQERGDGTGRVEGFYTITGEDGRERRVDYVADENGYRASVKTNEVGTRSESTADAQYQAEIPSLKQLEQAKVSYEQYKYLEDTHQVARERHQGHKLPNFSTSGSSSEFSSQFGQTDSNKQPLNSHQPQQQSWQQQQQQQLQQQQLQQQQQYQRQPVGSVSQSQLVGGFRSPSVSTSTSVNYETSNSIVGSNSEPVVDSSADWRSQSARLVGQRQTAAEATTVSYNFTGRDQQPQQQDLATPLPPPSSSSQQVRFAGFQQQQQPQSFNQRATTWSNSVARRPTTILQRQLEAQFMQQAAQLTNQDYPRQPTGQQLEQQRVNADFRLGGELTNGQQAIRPNDYSQFQRTVNQINQIQANYDRVEANDQTGRQQFNQQQANIIGDLGDIDQQVSNEGQQQVTNQANGRVESVDQPEVTQQQTNFTSSFTQSSQPDFSGTTTAAPASGFIAISLNETSSSSGRQVDDNSTGVNINTIDEQQEVDQRQEPRPTGLTLVAPQSFAREQQQQQLQQAIKTTNEEQLTVNQQVNAGEQILNQQQRPNSVNQIIEYQKQEVQQVGHQQPKQQQQLAIKQQSGQFQGLVMRAMPIVSTQGNFRQYEQTTAYPASTFNGSSASYFTPTPAPIAASTFTPAPLLTSSQRDELQQQDLPSTAPRVSNTLPPTRYAPYSQPTTTQLPQRQVLYNSQQQQLGQVSAVKGGPTPSYLGGPFGSPARQRVYNETTQLTSDTFGRQRPAQPTQSLQSSIGQATSGQDNYYQQRNSQLYRNGLSGVKGASRVSSGRRQFWQQQQPNQLLGSYAPRQSRQTAQVATSGSSSPAATGPASPGSVGVDYAATATASSTSAVPGATVASSSPALSFGRRVVTPSTARA